MTVHVRLSTVVRTIGAILALTACGRADQQVAGPSAVSPQVLAPVTEQAWDTPMGAGWSYLRRSGSKDDDIVTDDSAPFGTADVLRIIFTPDMRRDSEPGVHWRLLPNANEVYAEWWMKLSPNWKSSPAGGGKIAFLWAREGIGQMYSGLFGSQEPHHISINIQWQPHGQTVWDPNVARTPIYYNRWYRIGWYAKWPSQRGGNGTVRWWVNGALDGNYTDIQFPAGLTGFLQFEFAPTLQFPPPAEQYMYIGPTRITTW
jgi:hypothetical protein